MHKKRNAIMAVLAVALVAALTIGGTLAYMTDSESLLNTFKVGDLDVTIKEPNYPKDLECPERVPGDSFPKDPTVRQVKGDAYMRVKVEFLNEDGTPITDAARIAKIQQTIYYDKNFSSALTVAPDAPGYKGSPNLRVWGSLTAPHNTGAYPYSTTQLAALVGDTTKGIYNWYNKEAFVLDAARSSGNTFYLNYGTSANDADNVFIQGSIVKVFTSIVFPSDWDQYDLNGGTRDGVAVVGIGNYQIRITAEVIQAANFPSRAAAYTQLDANVLKNYGVTGGAGIV